MDVTQAKLSIGLRTGVTCCDPEYPALVMLNAVLGSGVTSKLFVHVREERSLCYYASSSLEKFKGLMLINSGVEQTNCEAARDEILAQLEACRRGEITDEELDSAKRQFDSALRMTHDSPGALDDFYLGQALAGLDGTIDALREALLRVTKDELTEAAQRITLDTIYMLKGAQA
jgi:predicted Zn-dependent peptidase